MNPCDIGDIVDAMCLLAAVYAAAIMVLARAIAYGMHDDDDQDENRP